MQIVPQPVRAIVCGPQVFRGGDRYGPEAGLVGRQPRDANQQRVGALSQQRGGQQLVARGIPGTRERFDQARVAHQQTAVEIHRAGHVQVVEQQRHGLAWVGALPAQAIPDHAVEAGPARGPDVRQRHGYPAGDGRAIVLPGRLCGFDSGKGDGLRLRPGASCAGKQHDAADQRNKPEARASKTAWVRE
ncbi:hypothetical protein HpMS107_53810 [Helicobacter pylori]